AFPCASRLWNLRPTVARAPHCAGPQGRQDAVAVPRLCVRPHSAAMARGVLGAWRHQAGDGRHATGPVPDAVIDEIRPRERGGLIELPKPPVARPGHAVKILRGPFSGRLAIYAGMRPKARVEVLLSLLGSSQRVTLAADAVEAV